MIRRATLAGAAVAALALAGCSSDAPSDAREGDAPTTTVASAETDLVIVDGLVGERYCEILAITEQDGTNIAEVYNTIELNECPADDWEALDTSAVAADLEVDLALRNGPRYWAIDRIEKVPAEGERPVVSLDGLDMRVVATVDVGASLADAGARYVPRAVDRQTVFAWPAGAEVHELTDPDGQRYVLQAWSQQIDPELSAEDLAGLGERLELPDGWSFATRALDAELVIETLDEPARVLQDDLGNAYTQVPEDS